MSVRLRLLIFAAGAALFLFLVAHVGPGVLLANFRRAGFTLIPIVLLWVPVFLCWNTAWWLTMHGAERKPPFWRILVVGVAGHSLNDVTPFAQVGGEPFRIGALSPWLGKQRAAASVVTYYMLHAMSNMVVWLAGIVLVLALYHPPTPLVVPLLVALLLIVALIAFVFTRHQQGIVAPLVRFLGKVPLAGRLVRRIEAKSPDIEELDRTITGFYHASPGRFWLALLLDTVGRFVAMFEYWLVAHAISVEMSVLQTIVIGSFSALAINVIFFMPLQAGSKEGGLYFAFRLAGLDASLGIFAALVQRVREWTWIGVGLLLIWLAGERVDRGSPKARV
jgi:uncharacterized protein (TIRG00374 family)